MAERLDPEITEVTLPTRHESRRRGKEFREIPDEQAKFLAGIFEMGGSFMIFVRRPILYTASGEPREYPQVLPVIEYNDNSEEKIDALRDMFGGYRRRVRGKNSWKWTISGMLAYHLANAIGPYAPNRQEEIQTFQRLNQTEALEDRISTAHAMSRYNNTPKSYPDLEAYEELVQDPPFAAGVYEGRGNVYDDETPLAFESLNISLITALQERYGGSISAAFNERVARNPEASVPISFQLHLGLADRRQFLQIAYPHIISNRAEIGEIIGAEAA